MKKYSIHITPPRGWPVRHEFCAHSEDKAAEIARTLFPRCTYSRPRDVTPVGYKRDFVDSLAGLLPDRMPA